MSAPFPCPTCGRSTIVVLPLGVRLCPTCADYPAPTSAEQAAAALRDSLSPMAARNRAHRGT